MNALSSCWLNFTRLIILSCVVPDLGCPFVGAVYHSVDLDQIKSDLQPDQSRLRDSEYFHSWLKNAYSPSALKVAHASALTHWDYNTNITDQNTEASTQSSQDGAKFARIARDVALQFDLENSTDQDMKDIRKRLTLLGDASLTPEELKEMSTIITHMQSVYSTAWICFDAEKNVMEFALIPRAKCPRAMQTMLEPSLTDYFRHQWDLKKRKYAWREWRDVSGRVIRKEYTRYVELKNKAAKATGYEDAGHMWRAEYIRDALNYTDKVFLADLDRLWDTIKPLYAELHAYVRRVLIKRYPEERLTPKGPIPAHMIGEMFSQDWGSMLSFTQLFPRKPLLDVTDEMRRQNYTVRQMFELSEQFQKDLGLKPMPKLFWENSMFVQPTDRNVVCHASAWDMKLKDDVRIKMCTKVNMEDLITIHHEMGHIQYDLQYAPHLSIFRDGANRGFHEAVGDTLALSVKTPKHLAWLKLLKNNVEGDESDLNYMFSTALDKIAFLPFAYVMDRYRYDVFSGKIPSTKLTKGWWDYVLKYQGIKAPVPRSENDFDPGAKYHIAADVEYMRYFVSYILQFQFHKALCNAAGHTGPLYQCDINQSKAAGKLFGDMLSLGASQPWQLALEKMTGSQKMDAGPIMEFFEPLLTKIRAINSKNGDVAGW